MKKYDTSTLIRYGIFYTKVIPIVLPVILGLVALYFFFLNVNIMTTDYMMAGFPLLVIIVCSVMGGLLFFRLTAVWRNWAFNNAIHPSELYYQSFDSKLLTREDEKEKNALYTIETNEEKKQWKMIQKDILNKKYEATSPDVGSSFTQRKIMYPQLQNYFITFLSFISILIGLYLIALKEDGMTKLITIIIASGIIGLVIGIRRIKNYLVCTISQNGIDNYKHGLIGRSQITDISFIKILRPLRSADYIFTYTYQGGTEKVNLRELNIGITEIETLLKKYHKDYTIL